MRIGFDISQTGKNKAGCGFMAYSLIRALAKIDQENEYLQYPTFGDFYFDPDWKKDIQFVQQTNFKKGLAHNNFSEARSFWNASPVDFEEQLGNPDIIQSNNFYCPKGLEKAKLIYTLHDMGFLEEPDTATEANRVGCFNGVFRASLFADHIISVSEYSRNHYLRIFPHYPEEKISVVSLASRFPSPKTSPLPIPKGLHDLNAGEFWFNLGTLEPRKNQLGLIKAYAMLREVTSDSFPLVIAGGKGWQMEHFDSVISELGLTRDVIKLGYIDDDQLLWLYRHCFAFIYPAIFEGFGLPVLEAMSQGAAIITSNVTSLPEVVGEAGIMIDPFDGEALCEAMLDIYSGKVNRDEMKSQALERSANFSWEKSARKFLDLYQTLID